MIVKIWIKYLTIELVSLKWSKIVGKGRWDWHARLLLKIRRSGLIKESEDRIFWHFEWVSKNSSILNTRFLEDTQALIYKWYPESICKSHLKNTYIKFCKFFGIIIVAGAR